MRLDSKVEMESREQNLEGQEDTPGDVHQPHQDNGLPWRKSLQGIELMETETNNTDFLDGDHQPNVEFAACADAPAASTWDGMR